MKTASELHDEWARGRGVDSPEESQAKQQAWLEAKEAEEAAPQVATEAPVKPSKGK